MNAFSIGFIFWPIVHYSGGRNLTKIIFSYILSHCGSKDCIKSVKKFAENGGNFVEICQKSGTMGLTTGTDQSFPLGSISSLRRQRASFQAKCYNRAKCGFVDFYFCVGCDISRSKDVVQPVKTSVSFQDSLPNCWCR